MLAALAVLTVVQTPAVEAQRPEVPLWLLSAEIEASSTAAFDDAMALGAGVAVKRRLVQVPLYVGGRLAWTRITEANTAFKLTHDHLWAEVVGGKDAQLEVGRIFVEVGFGATAIIETRRRHQYERLSSLKLDSKTRRTHSLGPSFLLNGGLAVRFYENLSVTVAGGPCFALLEVAEESSIRLGWHAHLGLGYAL